MAIKYLNKPESKPELQTGVPEEVKKNRRQTRKVADQLADPRQVEKL